MTFDDLGLSPELLRAVSDAGYTIPTPIQAQAIPVVLTGRDVLGCAQTGTGKTAGFTLPMIEILGKGRAKARMPRSLILEPTRELADQVSESFEKYAKFHKLSKALLIGGMSFGDQQKVLDRGADVLIATPGRLLDHFERGGVLLNDVKILVIDEADRMLDMGFIPDVERIVGLLPRIRQTLFFSATMPPEIRRLADAFLSNPKEISVSPPTSAAVTVTQNLLVVDGEMKREALRRLIASEQVKNALIFCNRKRDVDTLVKSLNRHGFNVAGLHGDMAQSHRMATLERFKTGEITFLVCSDVAARGLDIIDLSHVFNFDVPIHAEDYIHRIGRTGRAGREGRAFTLATPADGRFVAAIEKLVGKAIPRVEVPGLDQPALEEGDGRRPRGRAPARSGSAKSGHAKSERGRRPPRERHDAPPPAAAEQPAAAQLAPPPPAAQQPAAQQPAPPRQRPEQRRGSSDDRDIERSRARREGRRERHGEARPDAGQGPQPYEDRPNLGKVEHMPAPPREPRRDRRPDRRDQRDDGPPVVGFGDQMPAFLARKVG